MLGMAWLVIVGVHRGDVTNCAEVWRFLQGAWGLDGHWVVGGYGCGGCNQFASVRDCRVQ